MERMTHRGPDRLAQAMAMHRQGRLAEAQALYEEVLEQQSEHFDALHLLGVLAAQARNPARAVSLIDRALAADPCNTAAYAAYLNRGLAQQALGQSALALASYDSAIALKADCAEAHFNRGNVLHALKQLEASIASYSVAIALGSRNNGVHGTRCHVRMEICDWRELATQSADISLRIRNGQPASDPFVLLTLSHDGQLQRRAAQNWVRAECQLDESLGGIGARARHARIRVGYFSADFREHAVATLMAGVFEAHDRSRFEVSGFSFGPDTGDPMRRRLEGAFERFIDVRYRSDREVAQLARRLEIDIAVDLGGFTADGRPRIFALRAAPLQVSYLGYLGTMAAPYMDYLIADAALVPQAAQRHYAEKIVYLPSYQANDCRRPIAEGHFSRLELGLPATGMVYCCFNANYKLNPATFGSWMRILQATPGSVLFLYAGSAAVVENLRREARSRGVAAERLVFGGKLPFAQYLARYRTADLFLDTLPYNAGTTASDALWAGLPVLTCAGETLAARMGASLLQAVGLPELITANTERYEQLAIELGRDPQRLEAIR